MTEFVYFWIAIILICGVIEVMTVGLATIWFAAGGILALLLAINGVGPGLQIVVFLAVSIALLVLTRPFLVRRLQLGKDKTNVDALVGMKGLVVSEIREFETGQVKVNGQVWTASSEHPFCIKKDTRVRVDHVDGVKLVVSLYEEEGEPSAL
jgi:membrane protein implicated in regulation of membrane protease activity